MSEIRMDARKMVAYERAPLPPTAQLWDAILSQWLTAPDQVEFLRGMERRALGRAYDAPLGLEWRPVGFLASKADLKAQWQRERGLEFWRAQAAGQP